ncbi:MAG: CopG family transcriptional regulator [Alteromonadaceae bacterium]|nr:CopG family transcriptional regulator [Alteromonadaceae bacterium]
MPRQSITFSQPNDHWLQAQVDSKEYNSKTEVVNDIIRQARKAQDELDVIRAELILAEKNGFSRLNIAEIRQEALKNLK